MTANLVFLAFMQFRLHFIEASFVPQPNGHITDQKDTASPKRLPSDFEIASDINSPEWEKEYNSLLSRLFNKSFFNPSSDFKKNYSERAKREIEKIESPIEKSFFSFDLPIDHPVKVSPMLCTIMRTRLPCFVLEPSPKGYKFTFPSFTIMKIFLDRTFMNSNNEVSVRAQPVLGKLKISDIRQAYLNGEVLLNIPFFMERVISKGKKTQWADNYVAGPFGFLIHDIYHYWRKSLLSSHETRVVHTIIEILEETIKNLQEGNINSVMKKLMKAEGLNPKNQDDKRKAIRYLKKDSWIVVDMDKGLKVNSPDNLRVVVTSLSPFGIALLKSVNPEVSMLFNDQKRSLNPLKKFKAAVFSRKKTA